MEDKCKLNFDLHVCHQLLNTQAKISQFLSAKAEEKLRKETHKQGNYKTLDWTLALYQALKIFHWKIRTKTHPQERKECGFLLAEERKKRKTFFSHTDGTLSSSVRGVFRSHGVSKFSYFCCHDALHKYGRDWTRFDQNEEKFHLLSTLCRFGDFLPFSRIFPGLENWWGNFKPFQEFKTFRTLCIGNWSSVVFLVVLASKKRWILKTFFWCRPSMISSFVKEKVMSSRPSRGSLLKLSVIS